MQPIPYLPPEHPLLNYQYSDSDQWTAVETEAFHRAIDKFDKDFFSVAKEVSVLYFLSYDETVLEKKGCLRTVSTAVTENMNFPVY